jgi:hypothetical protein
MSAVTQDEVLVVDPRPVPLDCELAQLLGERPVASRALEIA